MKRARVGWLAVALAMGGCVHGYGGCLFVSPVKHTLSGRVHFRTFPGANGVDRVPILELDHIAYIYSPAQSLMCIPADELQLEGISEFPESVVENSHVSVQGQLVAATSTSDHTHFLMQVITLLPDNSPH
jgi:hypothetical protein